MAKACFQVTGFIEITRAVTNQDETFRLTLGKVERQLGQIFASPCPQPDHISDSRTPRVAWHAVLSYNLEHCSVLKITTGRFDFNRNQLPLSVIQ